MYRVHPANLPTERAQIELEEAAKIAPTYRPVVMKVKAERYRNRLEREH